MKKNILIILLISILLLSLSAVFFGCQVKENIEIELIVEGDIYRGSASNIYAKVKGTDDYSDIKFEVVEKYNWAIIQNQQLLITADAVVGATVTVRVTLGECQDSLSLVVGNTPLKSLSINEIPQLTAGSSYVLSSKFDPVYADDVKVEYEVINGNSVADIVDGVLYISREANYTDDVRIVAKADGKTSEVAFVKISTVQPESLKIEASSYTLKRGEFATIKCVVTPSNCTLGEAELVIPESDYYTYNKLGVLTVSDLAPEGEIEIKAHLGALTETIRIKIVKTPVERIDFTASKEGFVRYGDIVELSTNVIPTNATYGDVSISVIEGEEYLNFLSENVFEITAHEEGKQIVIIATADGVNANLVFETESVPLEDISVKVDGSSAVSVGTTRTLTVSAVPENAKLQNLEFEIVEGGDYAVLDNNSITFVSVGQSKTKVAVTVRSGEISKTVVFFVVPVPVESIEISTNDPITDLKPLDTVCFTAVITPTNASFSNLTYKIQSGEQFGSIEGNVFTVSETAGKGSVSIYAESDDGVRSNTITIEIFGNVKLLTPATWSSIDNKATLLDGTKSVRIDFSLLEQNADYTTLIISDDVEYIEFVGKYNQSNSVIYNLSIYFLTTDNVYCKFENFAIVSNGGFGEYVVDFGNMSTVVVEVIGTNYIEASSVYMPSAADFTVNGLFEGNSSDYLRKAGMDGFGGLSGGTAINACNLQISGKGDLKLVAGSGSNGTDGTNGADSESTVFAGKGGNGGYGGDSGYAIFCDTFICNIKGTLSLIGGNAGNGGTGGKGGINANTSYSGVNGIDGEDGKAKYPIFSNTQTIHLTNNYSVTMGKVVNNNQTRTFVYDDFAETIEKFYKINVHYGTDLSNPHYLRFSMTEQTSVVEITKMLHALDYALQVFPKNLYSEIMTESKNKINIYIVKSITRKPSSIVYGLTSDVNNVWFATFDTRLRGVYYSTPYNIMVHELLHVLTYNLDDQTNKNLEKTLPSYNLGYSYTTTNAGVYDPDKGYGADNSVFLCAYSKSSYSEDVSDNLSMVGMLVTKPDYLAEGKAFNKKIAYINSVYVGFYKTLAPYTPLKWMRYI